MASNWVFLYTPKELWEEVAARFTPPIKITIRALGMAQISSKMPKAAQIGATNR